MPEWLVFVICVGHTGIICLGRALMGVYCGSWKFWVTVVLRHFH